jgi:hypothetical protein
MATLLNAKGVVKKRSIANRCVKVTYMGGKERISTDRRVLTPECIGRERFVPDCGVLVSGGVVRKRSLAEKRVQVDGIAAFLTSRPRRRRKRKAGESEWNEQESQLIRPVVYRIFCGRSYHFHISNLSFLRRLDCAMAGLNPGKKLSGEALSAGFRLEFVEILQKIRPAWQEQNHSRELRAVTSLS